MAESPYLEFTRAEWAALRESTPMTLDAEDVETLRGINVALSVQEVEEVYLPLSRLLNLYVQASQELSSVTERFLGRPDRPVPYLVGLAGSVAVGKSTIARVLQALLSRWPDHPRVDFVTTDGFLFPNVVLEERGLMNRKGFPESYDRRALLDFVTAVKSGEGEAVAPVYSHLTYDVVADASRVIRSPDVLILDGLNVLQGGGAGTFVSDYFDFSIFVDAEPADIRSWYVERFLTLRDTAFRTPGAYFRRYAELSDEEARETAAQIWTTINLVNLEENIAPTRERATLILHKAADHSVDLVRLRRR
jgi:type I pantothenate kinase